MSNMSTIQDLRSLDRKGLLLKLKESRKTIFDLHIQVKTKQIARPHEIGDYKRYIAQIQTVLSEKEGR